MCFGGDDPPAPAPAQQTAYTQQQFNRDDAKYQTALNQYDYEGPSYSRKFEQTSPGDSSTPPRYVIKDELTEPGKTAFNNAQQAQQSLSEIGKDLTTGIRQDLTGPTPFAQANVPGRINQLDTSGLVQLPTSASQLDDERQAAADTLYRRSTMRMDPQYAQAQEALDTKLANQGITQGSEAYKRAMDLAAQQKADDYERARLSADAGGAAEQARILQMQSNLRNTGFNEQAQLAAFQNAQRAAAGQENAYEQGFRINQLGSIFGTGRNVALPTIAQGPQATVSPTNYAGIQTANDQQAMNAYNQQQQSSAANAGAVGGLLGTAAGSIFGMPGVGGAVGGGVGRLFG